MSMELIDRNEMLANILCIACGDKDVSVKWLNEYVGNYPTVKAIPKDQYEARLKADMVAMLTEILTDFDNQIEPNSTRIDCESIIEQKIQTLEGKTDGELTC